MWKMQEPLPWEDKLWSCSRWCCKKVGKRKI